MTTRPAACRPWSWCETVGRIAGGLHHAGAAAVGVIGVGGGIGGKRRRRCHLGQPAHAVIAERGGVAVGIGRRDAVADHIIGVGGIRITRGGSDLLGFSRQLHRARSTPLGPISQQRPGCPTRQPRGWRNGPPAPTASALTDLRPVRHDRQRPLVCPRPADAGI
jgi:hypothetical protein